MEGQKIVPRQEDVTGQRSDVIVLALIHKETEEISLIQYQEIC